MTNTAPQGPGDNQYCRVLLDIEVEITDETQLAAYLFDWGTDADGQPGMVDPDPDLPGVPNSGQQQRISRALTQLLIEGMASRDSGLKFKAGSPRIRPVTEDGNHYRELPGPPLFPRRRADGTYADLPSE